MAITGVSRIWCRSNIFLLVKIDIDSLQKHFWKWRSIDPGIKSETSLPPYVDLIAMIPFRKPTGPHPPCSSLPSPAFPWPVYPYVVINNSHSIYVTGQLAHGSRTNIGQRAFREFWALITSMVMIAKEYSFWPEMIQMLTTKIRVCRILYKLILKINIMLRDTSAFVSCIMKRKGGCSRVIGNCVAEISGIGHCLYYYA